ncbi:MAG: hypothetical protein CMJ18_05875 [Phycisphaeraceae bacterium]|nr:hypothetical protein [Phycisphaeraceae bacterium]
MSSIPRHCELLQDAGDAARLEMCVLASGSGGNCTIMRHGAFSMLMDAGLGPRTIARRLATARAGLNDLGAVVVTHLDQDHFRPTWVSALLRLQLPLFLHRWHDDDLARVPGSVRLRRAGLVTAFGDEPFEPVPGMTLHPIRLAHDQKGTCGFRVEAESDRLGYATDLGHVPQRLVTHFTDVELLAIESNYDPHLQRSSGRPIFLQRRIMGRAGHLSNEQAFAAVREILGRSERGNPRTVVLLHRSAQCNRPRLIHDMFAQDERLANRVVLAEQRRITQWLKCGHADSLTGNQLDFRF